MWCLPDIKKNLISISKFDSDNDVLIEFYSHFYAIKDRHTKTLLLKANLRNGLYHIASSLTAIGGKRVSINLWHVKLGHSSS
jgi:hypothetical protein